MELLDIKDPKSYEPLNEKIYAVGIDFGTTNSLVAYSIDKKPFILKNEDDESLTKSIYRLGDIELKSIKRLIGKSYEEIMESNYLHNNYDKILVNDNGRIKLRILDNLYSPVEIAAEILKKIKNYSSIRLGCEVDSCVITVPAYFNENAKSEIKFAAKLAGFNVLRLIAEPTSAAYSYGLDNANEGYYLVYDFGGGTFDVSLIKMKMGVFNVIATAGDNLLGGDDIDIAFRNYLSSNLCETSIEIAQSIKEKLSKEIEVIYNSKKISRNDFNGIINSFIDRTIKISSDLISRSEINIKNILGIILVGGSSRIPLVREKLKDKFNLELFDNQDPETIVALGAGLVAENLTFKNNNLIIDILPLSIGLEIYGGFVEKIIERNTQIPFSVKKQYTTYADNQTAMKFHIVQGERELVKDCRSIGFFELKNISPMKAGFAKIELTFTIDADCLISIEAHDIISHNREKIEINSSYGITNQEINQMLEIAYKNAQEDHNDRLLLEYKIKGKDLIKSINILISEYSDKIDKSDLLEITTSIDNLEKAISDKDSNFIRENTKKLKDLSNFLVEMKLNHDILSVIKGQNINNI
jgi:molecular chaperone HscA